jgi:hypothetical protein
MDEYIQADNDFRQKEGRKRSGFLTRPGALEEDFILGMSGLFIIPIPIMKGSTILKIAIIAHNL